MGNTGHYLSVKASAFPGTILIGATSMNRGRAHFIANQMHFSYIVRNSHDYGVGKKFNYRLYTQLDVKILFMIK